MKISLKSSIYQDGNSSWIPPSTFARRTNLFTFSNNLHFDLPKTTEMFEIRHRTTHSAKLKRRVPIKQTDFQLSKFYFYLLKTLFDLLRFFGFAPFYADTTLGKISYSSGLCYGRCIHNWLWMTTYAVIVLPTHAVQLHLASDDIQSFRSNKFIIYLVLGILFCCTVTLVMGTVILNPSVICQLINSLLKYVESFPVKYVSTIDPVHERLKMRLFETLILITVGSMAFVISFVFIHCFLHPTAPAYPTFNVSKEYLSLPIYLFSCTWLSLSEFASVLMIMAILMFAELYFLYVFPVLRNEMKLGKAESRYKTNGILREPHHLVVNWRAQEILLKIFNVEIGLIIVPIQGIVTAIVLFCSLSLVFQWHLFRFNTKILLTGAAIWITTGWSIILFMAGQQYQVSIHTLESWKSGRWNGKLNRDYMLKFKRSCRPLGLGDGKRYEITPLKVLEFANSLSKNMFRAFIAYAEVFGV
ncbi:unnamed protein product [Orchesella dallaii]|uniref:Odorant receptor n=1 Tax=Orchesella dallaii TaxID=48710 RepID=A0ABP1S475_9HEXA